MVKAVVGEEARLTSAEDRLSRSAIPAEVLIDSCYVKKKMHLLILLRF